MIPPPPDDARDGVAASRARRVELAITGMNGSASVGRIERALLRCPGVLSVSVDPVGARARVSLGHDPTEPDSALAARLRDVVTGAGFDAVMLNPELPSADSGAPHADAGETSRLILAAALTAPLLVSMVLQVAFALSHQDRLAAEVALPGWVQFLLATLVLWLGRRVTHAAIAGLRVRAGNADQLAALGAWAAWGLSTFDMLRGAPGYFEVSALVMTLMLTGGWLERRALWQGAAAVRALLSLPAEVALRRDPATGTDQEVPLAALLPGDLLIAPTGAHIAADGVVRDGVASVEEPLSDAAVAKARVGKAPVTKAPVSKARGEPVFAGSRVAEGALVIEVRATGAQTRLAGLLRSMEASPVSARRAADRVSAVVAVVVLVLALLTFIGWCAATGQVLRALLNAVSVLVIACPCALGLAAPAALAAGITAAARAGIQLRDVAAVERLRSIGLVVLDNARLLTEGRPVLERVVPDGVVPGDGAQHYAQAAELLSLAAAMQDGHAHPLAAAVRASSGHAVTAAAERFKAVPGHGVSARIGGRSLLLGNRSMIQHEGIALPAILAEAADGVDAEGGTASFLAERRAGGGRILGMFGFSDPVRPDARQAMARLARRGIATVLLTADGEGAARHVAGAAGVDRLLAGLSPGAKAAAVAALAAEQRAAERPGVAVVGAGSDAADLSLATGHAGGLAGASIILLAHNPDLLLDAIEIAELTASHVRTALFWAFVYNLVGVPIAAAGLLSPPLAGAALTLASVSVLSSALRLRGWRPHPDGPPQPLLQ
ncbi:heavy metal translocating P-type ATPase [Lichenicoccus sp.]|uniref:heavy metal translocating P-type ATPase n=1 Tax=Lichenicoccus sp. TaxID=2781899 RepID=UPI003D102D87